MKTLQIDRLKRIVRLIPESSIDLINIYRVVEIGDVVYSQTSREIKKQRHDGSVDSERVKVRIGIRVEKKSADPIMRRISFLGSIIYVDRELDILKKHHTIHVEAGREIELESRSNFQNLLALAKTGSEKRRSFLCLALDDEQLALAHFSEGGVKIVKNVKLSPAGKQLQQEDLGLEEQLDRIAADISKILEQDKKLEIVLLGPAISIDTASRYLRNKHPSIFKAIKRKVSLSSGGEEGLREAMRSGVLGEDVKPLRDALIVEKAIREISSSPETTAIGLEEVYEAVKSGLAMLVLATEDYVWQRLDDEKLNTILSAAETGGLELRIVLSGTEAAEKINGLGGIIAILRTSYGWWRS